MNVDAKALAKLGLRKQDNFIGHGFGVFLVYAVSVHPEVNR